MRANSFSLYQHNEYENELTTESKLLVELIGARDLKTDWFGYVNPYCVVGKSLACS